MPPGNRPLIYLDHAATSPLRPEVWRAMGDLMGVADYNPASVHSAGGRAAEALEMARSALAESLGVPAHGVVLTGGGTGSDNLAVLGFARALGGRARLVVSAIEHKAVLESAARAAAEGARVEVVPVDGNGTVRVERLSEILAGGDGRPTLVSIMWANNEVGVVQPIRELCEIAHGHGAVFHSDAVQAVGKIPLSLADAPVDLLTVTAHKLGGPVGVGLLYVSGDVRIEPLAYGGSQEGGMWPGTQDPLGATGFAAALRLATRELPSASRRWRQMRDRLEEGLRDVAPDVRVHAGGAAERLPHILSVGFPGVDPATLLTALDLEGVSVSAGSACSSGSRTGSHVLEAMGVEAEEPYGVLRISFGPSTTAELVAGFGAALERVLTRLARTAT